jgi:hypothetical protein
MSLRRGSNPVVIAVCACVALGIAFYVWFQHHWSSKYQAERCESKIERSCDPAVLRVWATNLLAHASDYSSNKPPVHPSLVTVWHRAPYFLVRDREGYVLVAWGSGVLGGWGMAIGSPELKCPLGLGDSVREWKPGIYFWRRLQ